MVKNPRENSVHQRTTENGLAHDEEIRANMRANRETNPQGSQASHQLATISNEEVKGLGLLGAGSLLFVYTLGFFPALNWVVMAAAVALAFYGARSAHVWDRISQGYEYLKSLWDKNVK